MKSFELKPLKDNRIPAHIQKLLLDLNNVILVKDGYIIQKSLDEDFNSVVIESYEHALPDYINAFLDTEYVNDIAQNDEMYNFNIEHVNSGLLVHVPKNLYIKAPLHVFYIQGDGDLIQNTRLILEPNAQLNYFEYLYNETNGYVNFVSNTIVKENAQLSYTGLSNLDDNVNVDIRRNSYVFRYGRSHYSVAEVNDGTIHNETNIFLQEPYASGTSKTIAITSNEQAATFRQMIEHNAPETEGFIENYGVSNHASSLLFEGVGKINKHMKHSVASQSNRGIVLGQDSRLDANPLLLIDEYDVEASHGAAIGKIDEDQLYYLMSRGLTLKVAERLIISGFLSPVLRILTTDTLRDDFIQKVEVKTS